MAAKKAAKKKARAGLSAEERAAMRDRARELKKRPGNNGERDVLDALAAMPKPDREIGERLHAIVREHAPTLVPRTWYGMPAYAKEGKVLCFFQGADKFKARYATLGFSDEAALDEGDMWPTSFGLKRLGTAQETAIVSLLTRALG